jgi:multidrug efflux pump subunit AcrB
VDAGQFLLHVRARTGTRIEETIRLCADVDAAIRQEIPAKEIHGIMDNIGIPNSSVNLSYNTSGVIGPGDADIMVALNSGHQPTEVYIHRLRKVLNEKFPGNLFYFLPADIVSQTLNFGLPAPFDIQIVGRDQANNRPRGRRTG